MRRREDAGRAMQVWLISTNTLVNLARLVVDIIRMIV